jgi:hypothetical protein
VNGWRLDTLPGCALVIGRYPRFAYNAAGGMARGTGAPGSSDQQRINFFPPNRVSIPALCTSTTRFLGLPLPPGLRIGIEAEKLEGVLDRSSGSVQLQFAARFCFELHLAGARRYRAPDLLVSTTLTTGTIESRRHRCEGRALNAEQRGCLVGVAMIQPSGEAWLDRFLGLPDEALAVLECRLSLKE